MLVAYALVDRPDALVPGAPGGDPRVKSIGDGPYLLADERESAPAATIAPLRAHDELVRTATARAACLPFRFGTTFPDEAAALAWLEPRRAAVREALERVQGCVEFDLHPMTPRPRVEAAPASGGPGTAHLASLRERYATEDPRLQGAEERARREMGELVRDARRDATHVAFLVRDADRAAFDERARRSTDPEWRWSGPWPAYTFASAWVAP